VHLSVNNQNLEQNSANLLRYRMVLFFFKKRMQMRTKDERIQTFVRQVFIDQYFFLFLRATSQEPNQIAVLEFGYELDFVFELCETLP
jgi:hypothetical protein